MTIEKARKILGETYAKRTDEEIQEIVSVLTILADISIDGALKKGIHERS